jgi:hypothetical protein
MTKPEDLPFPRKESEPPLKYTTRQRIVKCGRRDETEKFCGKPCFFNPVHPAMYIALDGFGYYWCEDHGAVAVEGAVFVDKGQRVFDVEKAESTQKGPEKGRGA